MENRKLVSLIVSLALSQTINLTFPGRVFGYEVQTHAGITKEAVAFYNQYFPEKSIAPEEAKKMIEGSILEDDAPRWFNHYYDPIYNRGLTGPFIPIRTVSSKVWAHDKERQISILYNPILNTTLSTYAIIADPEKVEEVDYTWERAIRDYIKGDKERAFRGLGQIIHLIEDASVPDHTRNDAHVAIAGHGIGGEGSPYELWTNQFGEENTQLLQFLFLKKPIILDSLDVYFDSIANYSNRNFYSKDTIDSPEYAEPKPDYFVKINDHIFAYKKDLENGDYKLALKISSVQSDKPNLILEDQGNSIMRDYWERLAPKAVQHAAGVINLFFKEVERLKNDPAFQPHERESFIGSVIASFKKLFWSNQKSANVGGGLAQVAEIILDNSEKEKPEAIPAPQPTPPAPQPFPKPASNAASPPLRPAESKPAASPAVQKVATQFLPDGDQILTATSTATPTNNLSSASSISNPTEASVPASCGYNSSSAVARGNVILNEVAWAGTTVSPSNEWLELKNLSNTPVDISGWYLFDQPKAQGVQISVTFPAATIIPATSFWLLERTDDTTVPNIVADHIYKGDLKNSNDGLRLYDASCVLRDEATTSPDWPAGSAVDRRSMERLGDFSWGTFNGNGDGTVLGTPRAENSALATGIPSYSAAPATPAPLSSSPPPPAEPPPPTVLAKHVVISEIMAGIDGNAEYEFVELYNPTDAAINLSGWSLKKRNSSGSETNLVSSSAFAGTIAPKSFFLIAHNKYSGAASPDLRYSANSQNLAYTSNAAVLYDAAGAKVDEASWEEIAKGESIERRAFYGSGCVPAATDGKYLGNACDTGASTDFDKRAAPEPQNSKNLPEPRTQAAASDFGAFFNPTTMRTIFSWSTTTDAVGSTTTTYLFEDKSVPGKTTVTEMTDVGFSRPFTQVGREYNFALAVRDSEGLLSATTTVATATPSYFKDVVWYPHPRSAGDTIVDIYHDKYPFLPNFWRGPAWKGLVIYKNTLPHPQDTLDTAGRWEPTDLTDVLTVRYVRSDGDERSRSSLILPDSAERASDGHGIGKVVYSFPNIEDGIVRLYIPGVFTETDFITFANYDFSESGGGNQSLMLIASDHTRWFFRESATNTPPTPPASLLIEGYITPTRKAIATFQKSRDPDGLDGKIRYQFNVASSTEDEIPPFEESAWGPPPVDYTEYRGAPPVFYFVMSFPAEVGATYRLGLRAIDELGATSTVSVSPDYEAPVAEIE